MAVVVAAIVRFHSWLPCVSCGERICCCIRGGRSPMKQLWIGREKFRRLVIMLCARWSHWSAKDMLEDKTRLLQQELQC